METLLEFAHHMREVSGWLGDAKETLEDYSRECDGKNEEAVEALKHFTEAFASVNKIIRPLLPQIASAESAQDESEQFDDR